MAMAHSLLRGRRETAPRDELDYRQPKWRFIRTSPGSRDIGDEPSLIELLSDPIAHALMRADGVLAEEVVATVEDVRERLAAASEGRVA